MWDQLVNMIQDHVQQSVVNNPEVPNEYNTQVIEEAKNAITSKLADLNASGQTEQAQALLNGAGHPEAAAIQNNFASSIMEKFGINSQAASGIAATLIPAVLGAIRGQGGGAGGLNIQDLLQNLGGGNLQSTLSGLGAKMGLDKDGDGDVDLNDVTKMFKL